MKKTIITAILAAMTLLLIGCSASNERIDLTDPLSGSSILSAADLEAFFKYGENDTAVLAASFSMEDTMLKLTAQRGSITIDGNGYTLSGTGDCIIRLDEGCKLTLNDITVHSGSTAIGCLGSAEIGGENANIIGVSDGILCADELIVSEQQRPGNRRRGYNNKGRSQRIRGGSTGRSQLQVGYNSGKGRVPCGVYR